MKALIKVLSSCVVALCMASAAMAQDDHKHKTPGADKTTKTKVLEAGAELTQGNGPISAIHQHVCGFHFYSGQPKRQVTAYHYCSHHNEDVLQCVIYESDAKNARLIGIEYIISEDLFKSLPEEEKKLWHSHRYEVMSGQLIAPGVPGVAEKEVMKKLVNTYGKTWHTWQIDRGDKLPLGVPQLMMGFTADGQADQKMVEARDKLLGVSTEKKKKDRADIPTREIAPGADAWLKGPPFQLSDPTAPAAPNR
ncbi:DUF1264 domain-containing protein [Verrucomicrobia bacterium LW23]|nr:DUF1264 domain-containing protein [Verrucomicrobia bacterium LW23]